MDQSQENIERLRALVTRFGELQKSLNMSDNKFAERFREYLGSQKAWASLKAGRFDGYLKPEKMVIRLERMAAALDGGAPVEEFFDSLPFTRHMDARLELLSGAVNDRLCLVCLAVTGCGKSVWARRKASLHPNEIIYCRARPTWRENTFAILQGFAKAIGCGIEKSPRSQADTLISALQGGSRRTIIIDEAHDGGVAMMKIVKMLIDETGTRFVYLAYPTEWDRMIAASEGALAEAKQLLGRAQKPIFDAYRLGVGNEDVSAYLRAAAGLDRDIKAVAEEMLPLVRRHGNLRVLEDSVDEARTISDEEDKPLTAQLVHLALGDLCKQNRVGDKNGGAK